jgi:hypothetical protein
MYQVQCIKHIFLKTVPFQLKTMIQIMFPSIPCMILNKFDTSSSNSNLHTFKLNFEIESMKPAAEIMQLSHCFKGRLHVQHGEFWKGFHNEIEVKFHTLPSNTASHECWYSSTHYRMTESHECHYHMTQHHMNVGTVPHITT